MRMTDVKPSDGISLSKPRRRGRRGHNEGTIYRRGDGRWEARISLPDGTRKSYYGRTREVVRKRLHEELSGLERGIIPTRDERLTVARYLADWLSHVRPSIRHNTYLFDEQLIRLHILPSLGRNSLSKLTPAQVQRCLTELLNSELSPTTVRHVYGVLHKALEDALRLGHVQRNVSDAVTPPRRADQEMQVLTSDQAQVLLRTAEDHRLYALFVVAVTSGMRLGELLALQWRNVDLERKTLQVRATLSMRTSGHVGHDNNTFYRSKGRNAREGGSRQSTGDAGLFAPTKTKRSRRQIQ